MDWWMDGRMKGPAGRRPRWECRIKNDDALLECNECKSFWHAKCSHNPKNIEIVYIHLCDKKQGYSEDTIFKIWKTYVNI